MNFKHEAAFLIVSIYLQWKFVFALAVRISINNQREEWEIVWSLSFIEILFGFYFVVHSYSLFSLCKAGGSRCTSFMCFIHIYFRKILAKSFVKMHFWCRMVGIDSAIQEKSELKPTTTIEYNMNIWFFQRSRQMRPRNNCDSLCLL